MIREGLKLANLTCNSALIDSDILPMRLVHKMSVSIPRSTQFLARPNPFVGRKPLPCQRCREVIRNNRGDKQQTFQKRNRHYKPKPKYLVERSLGYLSYRHQMKPDICQSTVQRVRLQLDTASVATIMSMKLEIKTRISFSICNPFLWRVCQIHGKTKLCRDLPGH
ncbi:hypothetical protein ACTXT7_007927 [Hymenolepis weldensis]